MSTGTPTDRNEDFNFFFSSSRKDGRLVLQIKLQTLLSKLFVVNYLLFAVPLVDPVLQAVFSNKP